MRRLVGASGLRGGLARDAMPSVGGSSSSSSVAASSSIDAFKRRVAEAEAVAARQLALSAGDVDPRGTPPSDAAARAGGWHRRANVPEMRSSRTATTTTTTTGPRFQIHLASPEPKAPRDRRAREDTIRHVVQTLRHLPPQRATASDASGGRAHHDVDGRAIDPRGGAADAVLGRRHLRRGDDEDPSPPRWDASGPWGPSDADASPSPPRSSSPSPSPAAAGVCVERGVSFGSSPAVRVGQGTAVAVTPLALMARAAAPRADVSPRGGGSAHPARGSPLVREAIRVLYESGDETVRDVKATRRWRASFERAREVTWRDELGGALVSAHPGGDGRGPVRYGEEGREAAVRLTRAEALAALTAADVSPGGVDVGPLRRRARGRRKSAGALRGTGGGGGVSVATRPTLRASAFANPKGRVAKDAVKTRAPDRATFSTAMKAISAVVYRSSSAPGRGKGDRARRRRLREQLLGAAGRLRMEATDVMEAMLVTHPASRSITSRREKDAGEAVLTGSFHPPSHRLESDRRALVERRAADGAEERRARRTLGVGLSERAPGGGIIGDAAVEKLVNGAPPLLFPSLGEAASMGGGLILGSPTRPPRETQGPGGGKRGTRKARRSPLAGEGEGVSRGSSATKKSPTLSPPFTVTGALERLSVAPDPRPAPALEGRSSTTTNAAAERALRLLREMAPVEEDGDAEEEAGEHGMDECAYAWEEGAGDGERTDPLPLPHTHASTGLM